MSVETLSGAFEPDVMQARGILATGCESESTSHEHKTRILAVRGSIVMQLSRLVARSMHLMRRTGFLDLLLLRTVLRRSGLCGVDLSR